MADSTRMLENDQREDVTDEKLELGAELDSGVLVDESEQRVDVVEPAEDDELEQTADQQTITEGPVVEEIHQG